MPEAARQRRGLADEDASSLLRTTPMSYAMTAGFYHAARDYTSEARRKNAAARSICQAIY